MTIKQIKMNDEFKEKMKKGIDIVADSVGITLGPKGRNVIIDNNYKQPTITNDGVTIAKKIELKDPFENLGAKIIKMAAENTQNVSGDGTTTSTILARRIIELGWKYLYDNNANPVKLNKELNNVLNMVLSKIVGSYSRHAEYNNHSYKGIHTHVEITIVGGASWDPSELVKINGGAIISSMVDPENPDVVLNYPPRIGYPGGKATVIEHKFITTNAMILRWFTNKKD